MTAFEQRHPHVAGRVVRRVVGGRAQHAAADAHALQVGDRLGEHRKGLRLDAVRRGLKALGERDRDLVVDPAMARIPGPAIGILGRDQHVGRTGDMLEILHAPGIDFADGHGSGGARGHRITTLAVMAGLVPAIARRARKRIRGCPAQGSGMTDEITASAHAPRNNPSRRSMSRPCASRRLRERAEGLHRVLVGVLGVDRLALGERERVPRDRHASAPSGFPDASRCGGRSAL